MFVNVKAAGKYKKKPKPSAKQIILVRERIAIGVPKSTVARGLGCSRSTLYEALDGTGKYAVITITTKE